MTLPLRTFALSTLCAVGIAAGASLSSSDANAGAMFSFEDHNQFSGDELNFVAGTFVTTLQSITITDIGFFDNNANGLTDSHGFRIFDQTNGVDLLGETIIGAGTGTLIDGFRYIDIPDIVVQAGVDLVILADNRAIPDQDTLNNDLMAFDLDGLSFDPALQFTDAMFLNNADVNTIPTEDLGQFSSDFDVLAGANILISPGPITQDIDPTDIPEPTTLALLGSGLLGIGLMAARRRRASRNGKSDTAIKSVGTLAAASMLATIPLGTAVASVSEIGTAEDVPTYSAYGTLPNEETQRIDSSDGVFAQQQIMTNRKGGMRLEFHDETELWVGAKSRLVVDEFSYNPETGAGSFVADLSTGMFRMMAGHINGGGMILRTPHAMIDVHGADFTLRISETGALRATVFDGTICIEQPNGTAPACIGGGETASVDGAGDVAVGSAGLAEAPDSAASMSGNGRLFRGPGNAGDPDVSTGNGDTGASSGSSSPDAGTSGTSGSSGPGGSSSGSSSG